MFQTPPIPTWVHSERPRLISSDRCSTLLCRLSPQASASCIQTNEGDRLIQNKTLKRLITWVVVASPLWWTNGCYTFVEITKLDEVARGNSELEITTEGNRVHVVSNWSVDSMGTVRVNSKSINPSYRVPERWDSTASVAGESKILRRRSA
jgi:hypothetical protein